MTACKIRHGLLTGIFLISAGCGSGPELVPVSGTVKIDGKPLDQGTVIVWIKNNRPAYGVIDSTGRFMLTTHKTGDGCARGEHPVTVMSETSMGGDLMTFHIPQRYKRPDTSQLKIVVDQPRDNWEIDLTWSGDRHRGPYTER